jgi:hypothetical protein
VQKQDGRAIVSRHRSVDADADVWGSGRPWDKPIRDLQTCGVGRRCVRLLLLDQGTGLRKILEWQWQHRRQVRLELGVEGVAHLSIL